MSRVVDLSNYEFYNNISNDPSTSILDVRTQHEYEQGHIPNAFLIDIYNPAFQSKIMELCKSKKYYIYCKSGYRSFYAGNFMVQMGFENVHHLKDGIISWTDNLEM